MRIIITGGTGVIGRQLTDRLIKVGKEVVILSRRLKGTHENRNVLVRQWDGCTTAGWEDLVDGTEAIVNLAGENLAGGNLLSMRWTSERKRRIIESRVNAGRAIVEAVSSAANKPQIIIQMSAIGYYGAQDSDIELTEDSPAGHDFLSQVCQKWEAATQEVEALGVRRVILRTGVVLSAHGGALPRQMLPFKFFVGGRLGNGRQWFSWVHIEDVVEAIVFMIENKLANGIYNLTAPVPVTNAEFSLVLGKVMGRPSLIPVPGFILRLLFGEASSILLQGQRVIPRRLSASGYHFQFAELEMALRDLVRS